MVRATLVVHDLSGNEVLSTDDFLRVVDRRAEELNRGQRTSTTNGATSSSSQSVQHLPASRSSSSREVVDIFLGRLYDHVGNLLGDLEIDEFSFFLEGAYLDPDSMLEVVGQRNVEDTERDTESRQKEQETDRRYDGLVMPGRAETTSCEVEGSEHKAMALNLNDCTIRPSELPRGPLFYTVEQPSDAPVEIQTDRFYGYSNYRRRLPWLRVQPDECEEGDMRSDATSLRSESDEDITANNNKSCSSCDESCKLPIANWFHAVRRLEFAMFPGALHDKCFDSCMKNDDEARKSEFSPSSLTISLQLVVKGLVETRRTTMLRGLNILEQCQKDNENHGTPEVLKGLALLAYSVSDVPSDFNNDLNLLPSENFSNGTRMTINRPIVPLLRWTRDTDVMTGLLRTAKYQYRCDCGSLRVSPLSFLHPEVYKQDERFVVEHIVPYLQEYRDDFVHLPSELRMDRAYLLSDAGCRLMLATSGSGLKHLSMALRDDADFILQIARRGFHSKDSSNSKDSSVSKSIVSSLVYFASKRLRNNGDDFVENMIEIDGIALGNAFFPTRQNRDLCIKAVLKNGLALLYCEGTCREDKELVAKAVRSNPQALEYAAAPLRKDPDFLLQLVEEWSITSDQVDATGVSPLTYAHSVDLIHDEYFMKRLRGIATLSSDIVDAWAHHVWSTRG